MALTNNDILKKLRVAHKLHDTDIVKILALVDFRMTTAQVNDLFRKPDHPKFVEAGDQVLRKFLDGLIVHLRGPRERK